MAGINQEPNVEFDNLLNSLKTLRVAVLQDNTAVTKRRPGARAASTIPTSTRETALNAVREDLKTISEHPYNQPESHPSRDGVPPNAVTPMRYLHEEVLRLAALSREGTDEVNTEKVRGLLASAIKAMGVNHPFLKTVESSTPDASPEPINTRKERATRFSRFSHLNIDKLFQELYGASDTEGEGEEDGEEEAVAGDLDERSNTRGAKKIKLSQT